ncbi:MAG: hypothetical protein JWP19_2192 [Rhodoglobus sp.]|nr:hypothetical protein [Rhodoglobus sp.]
MDSDEWRSLDITELMNLGASVRGERESFGWAKQTKEWANIVNQYQQCMSDLGYKFTKDQPFVPDGANSAVGEQSILVAIDDVQCKQQANLIQGLTDIVAAYEVSFIVSNEAALAEEQKMQQAKLDFADKIISSKS